MQLLVQYLGCVLVFICICGSNSYQTTSEEFLHDILTSNFDEKDGPMIAVNDVEDEDLDSEIDDTSIQNDPWFLRRFFRRNRKRNQCPVPKECKVGLPQHNNEKCRADNAKEVAIARHWYKITEDGKPSIIRYPYKYIPWLNQTQASINYYYATDPDEGRFLLLIRTWGKSMNSIRDKVHAAFLNAPFVSYQEYQNVYYAYEAGIKALGRKEYFGSIVDSPNWYDPIKNNRWENDDIFTKLLFVNNCPWSVKKVTISGSVGQKFSSLFDQLNVKSFDFDKAVTEAIGFHLTLKEAVNQERLYSLYHPEQNDATTVPDYLDKNASDTRVLRNATSPITLFVLDNHGELKVVAIQTDYKPDSPVFSPGTTARQDWLLAKGIAAQGHQDVCQVVEHLGKIHYVGSIHCFSYRRHFGKKHPIYQIMNYHCEGTVSHITNAYATLAFPHSFGHQLLTGGHVGVGEFVKIAYDAREYGQLDFELLLKEHGMDDDKVKFNPFRDDGRVVYDELKKFADLFVDLYYHDDGDVEEDKELQSFANEVSIDGKVGPNAGLGKYVGFPAEFNTKGEVKFFIRQFLWKIVMHALANYNLAPVYQPIRPIKLYEDVHPQASTYPYNLPDSDVTVGITYYQDLLSHFRANRMMDYFNKVYDKKLHDLVRKTHHRLHTCVQRQLSTRNAARKANGEPTFQVIEPAWLTNSVHI